MDPRDATKRARAPIRLALADASRRTIRAAQPLRAVVPVAPQRDAGDIRRPCRCRPTLGNDSDGGRQPSSRMFSVAPSTSRRHVAWSFVDVSRRATTGIRGRPTSENLADGRLELLIELAHDAAVQPAAGSSVAHAIRAGLRVGLADESKPDCPGSSGRPCPRADLLHEIRLARDHDKGLSERPPGSARRLCAASRATCSGRVWIWRWERNPINSSHTRRRRGRRSWIGWPRICQRNRRLSGGSPCQPRRNPQPSTCSSTSSGPRRRRRLRLSPRSAGSLSSTDRLHRGRDSAGSGEWATDRSRTGSQTGPGSPRARSCSLPAPSDERALLAVEAVGAGCRSVRAVAVRLRGRVRPLEAATIVRIVGCLDGIDGTVLEHALAIVSTGSTSPGTSPLRSSFPPRSASSMRPLGTSVSVAGGMVAFYCSHILIDPRRRRLTPAKGRRDLASVGPGLARTKLGSCLSGCVARHAGGGGRLRGSRRRSRGRHRRAHVGLETVTYSSALRAGELHRP